MEYTKKCCSCKKSEPKTSFDYGCLTCDKCMDYKREWNRKKAEEVARLYPKTLCEICGMYFRNENWDKHLVSARHKVNLKKQEQ